MQLALGMNQAEGVKNWWKYGFEECGAETAIASFDVVAEILSMLIVHHHVGSVVAEKKIAHIYDVGVFQCG